MLGALEMHGKYRASHGQLGVSAPRCSEKCVKVPDQIIVHSLVGFFKFISFLFFLRPSDDCMLAWSIKAHNICIFFSLCLTEQ